MRAIPPASADLPTFVVRLRPAPGMDAVKALRMALKVLKRRFGLVCLSVQEDDCETENKDGGKAAITERIFRYVSHADVEAYKAVGWVTLHCLGDTHHGRWSELMEWRGPEREHPMTPADDRHA